METILKQVLIPDDHHLSLDISVPSEIPAGPAEVLVVVSPLRPEVRKKNLRGFLGKLADSPAFSRGGVAIQREMRDEWD